jgi:hypothetical protein
MSAFGSTGRLAGVAGLAPVPRDSGRVNANMRRPHHYHRRLLRVFYLSAQMAARFCPTSRGASTLPKPLSATTSWRIAGGHVKG